MAKYLQDIRLSGGTVSIGSFTSSLTSNILEVNDDIGISGTIKALSGGSQLNLRVGGDNIFDITSDNGVYGESWYYGDTESTWLGFGSDSDIYVGTNSVVLSTYNADSAIQLKVGLLSKNGKLQITDDSISMGLSDIAPAYNNGPHSIFIANTDLSSKTNLTTNKWPTAISTRNVTLNQDVLNSASLGGADIIVKTNFTGYVAQLGFNKGGSFETIIEHATASADRTQTLQDASGTIALLSDISVGGSGVDNRITRWDGTNTIQSSDWFINDTGVLYPNTDGQDIGITGSNRIGNIYMSSRIDFASDGSGFQLTEDGGTSTYLYIAPGTGNIGINTIEPTEKLSIDGNINFLTGNDRSIASDDVTEGNGYGLIIQGGSSTAAGVTGGNIHIKAGSATNLGTGGILFINGGGGQSSGSTGPVLLQTISNGNVGIGYGLTSPSETLHVYDGKIKIEKPLAPANNTGLVLYNPSGAGANDFRIDFSTVDFGGTEYPAARIKGYNYNHSGTDVVSGELAFGVSNGVSDPVDALTINKYGNTKTTGQTYNIRTDNVGNGTFGINLTVKEQVIMAQAIGSRGTSVINYYLPDASTDGIQDGHVITFKTLNIVSGSIDIQSDLGILLDGSQVAATSSILLTPWRSRSFVYNNTFGYYLEITTGPDDVHNYQVPDLGQPQTLEQSSYYVRIPDPTGGSFTYSLPDLPCPSGKEIVFVTTTLSGGSSVDLAASGGATIKMLGTSSATSSISLSENSSYRFILDGSITRWYQV